MISNVLETFYAASFGSPEISHFIQRRLPPISPYSIIREKIEIMRFVHARRVLYARKISYYAQNYAQIVIKK